MKKKKLFLILSLVVEGLTLITFILLPIFGLVNIFVSIGVLVADVALIFTSVYLLARVIKKIKLALLKSKAADLTGDYLLDIYAILGIPVQYNKDGSIKSIYELLEIFPVYDETGTRLLTPYELLGLMPKFDANGREIPTVFVIKNRVGSIAKVDLSQRVLTRKPTEEEREKRLIEEALRQKMQQASANGDKKTAAVIQKALDDKKTAKTSKTPSMKYTYSSKPGKIKLPDNSEAVLKLFTPPKEKSSAPAKPDKTPEKPPQAPVVSKPKGTLSIEVTPKDIKKLDQHYRGESMTQKPDSYLTGRNKPNNTLIVGQEPDSRN